jgi:hypothetical protein
MTGVKVGVAVGNSVIGRLGDGRALHVHLARLIGMKLMRSRLMGKALRWPGCDLGAVN